MAAARARDLLERRFASQLLTGERPRDPLSVAERLLAIQGQDPRGARLAVRARSEGLSAADVDQALGDRSLIITTLNRGTLHLVRSEDYPWLHAITTPQLNKWSLARLEKYDVGPAEADRAVTTITKALSSEGPMTRAQLRERVAAAGVRADGETFIHIVFRAAVEGLIVRGPVIGRQHAFVLVRDWLGEPEQIDRDTALGELGRRFLAGHGPASDRDLAKWAGITLGDARKAFEAVSTGLDELEGDLVALKQAPEPAGLPPPRLLGAFDPILHGWASREPVLGEYEPLVTRGGMFKPFALARGRGVATWSLTAGRVELEPFGELARSHAKALATDADDVVRFLGLGSGP